MTERIQQFTIALLKTWGARVTGGVIIGTLAVWQLTGHNIKPWVGWTVIVGGVVTACFEIWNKERSLAERFKAQLQLETDKALNMRRAIYKEMFFLYANIRSFKNEIQEFNAHSRLGLLSFAKTMPMDAYRGAKSQSEIFFKLPEAYKIEGIYAHLTIVQQMGSLNPEWIPDGVGLFLQKVEEALRDPVFDLKLFKSITEETKQAFAQEIAKRSKSNSAQPG